MKYISLFITTICSLYSLCTYGMSSEADADQQRQRSASTFKRQDPDEMMRRFKQLTPPDELQRLQAKAREILERAQRAEEERTTAAVSRIVAH